MVESFDKMWSTEEGNGKTLQYYLENPMNSIKRQKDTTLKGELPRPAGVQIATGDGWRNNSRKNEGMEPKQKQLHRNLECQVYESRQIGSGETVDGKKERRHFRNQ